MTRILFQFIIYPSCERALKNGRLKLIMVRKLSLNFTFVQGSCFISDFARPNSNKCGLVQVFLRFEIVIFNNNFVFCMMSSFDTSSWLDPHKRNNSAQKRVIARSFKKYWKKLDKHLWQGLFCETYTTTYYSLLKMSHTLLEIWGRWWVKYE